MIRSTRLMLTRFREELILFLIISLQIIFDTNRRRLPWKWIIKNLLFYDLFHLKCNNNHKRDFMNVFMVFS